MGKVIIVPQSDDKEYGVLVDRIIGLWNNAKEIAITAVILKPIGRKGNCRGV